MCLDVMLDNCLSLEEHLKLILSKIKKAIGWLEKLQFFIPRSALLTIYKHFWQALSGLYNLSHH